MDGMVAPKIGFIIQARMNSSRLKGKILLPLPYGSATSLLEQIIIRVKAISNNAVIILATSDTLENKILKDVAEANSIFFYAGSENNVLQRFYEAAAQHKLDIIVRLTGDNPFIDPDVIHTVLLNHTEHNFDYTITNGLPLGTNIEVFSFQSLKKTYQEAVLPEHQEHVTPYIRLNNSLFKVNTFAFQDATYGQEHWRLTVDTESDYALACLLFWQLTDNNKSFSLKQTASFIYANPWVLLINKNNYQKKLFSNVAEEIKEAISLLHNNDLPNAAKQLAQNEQN
ncbi:acylneuraminate cytidylyltransferase [Adhaeribacter arboris]|uniref:Acylneuraminate cytidylyltransferase n=1 Tax=Adhaeribacter arboris TaxID=2072846 RepID=A0A2T2YAC0_9BACT|nr:glycosyltransferase family protein [Adhaeribacter arboris]PSR52457.1 acylneuraminate cytidylyltransferase [Adhaeribacter arboris]